MNPEDGIKRGSPRSMYTTFLVSQQFAERDMWKDLLASNRHLDEAGEILRRDSLAAIGRAIPSFEPLLREVSVRIRSIPLEGPRGALGSCSADGRTISLRSDLPNGYPLLALSVAVHEMPHSARNLAKQAPAPLPPEPDTRPLETRLRHETAYAAEERLVHELTAGVLRANQKDLQASPLGEINAVYREEQFRQLIIRHELGALFWGVMSVGTSIQQGFETMNDEIRRYPVGVPDEEGADVFGALSRGVSNLRRIAWREDIPVEAHHIFEAARALPPLLERAILLPAFRIIPEEVRWGWSSRLYLEMQFMERLVSRTRDYKRQLIGLHAPES